MTLEEARQSIGRKVLYRSRPTSDPDQGEIVRVNDTYVMVQYPGFGIAATRPEDLEFAS